jgi:hypothetical protein
MPRAESGYHVGQRSTYAAHIVRYSTQMSTQLYVRVAAAAAVALLTVNADAQVVDTSVTAGPHYQAGGLKRTLLGSNWRDLWTTPVTVPVLQPARFAGGLEFDKRGGNRQSITVHWKAEQGPKKYIFRSVDKFSLPHMAPEIRGSLVGSIIQDQTSTFFPGASILVHPLLQSISALSVESDLYVMEDSPRLGAIRDTVAGMLGTFELKPYEGPKDALGFGGASKIEDSDDFLETLSSGHDNRLDERELLAVRLIDLLINDTDRTLDNHDWARFGKKSDYTWRPIARDRDWAFMDARGLLYPLVVRPFYRKFTAFSPRYDVRGLLHSSHRVDRRMLQRLTAQDFRDVALHVQRAVTDSVIAEVVEQLPAEWRAQTTAAERLRSVLVARRAGLPDAAMQFYRDLATEVDVHGTDLAERAEIVRHSDGRVTVTITAVPGSVVATQQRSDGSVVTTSDGSLDKEGLATPIFFQRTFSPGETNEIRVYLGAGDDVATISGSANRSITVRIIGGKGNDVLADSAGAGRAHLYDEDGANRFVATSRTRVVTKPWDAPPPKQGLRAGHPWRPDWGGGAGFGPAFDYHSGAGVMVGGGFRRKAYGFRRLPHHWQASANLFYGTENGRVALVGDMDYRFENSPMAFTVEARASAIEAIRFFGYGNDTPDQPRELALVEQRVVAVKPALVRHIGWRAREDSTTVLREDTRPTGRLRPLVGEMRWGPALSWVDPEPRVAAPLATSGALGARTFSLAGLHVGLDLDRTDDDAVPTAGWTLRAAAEGYPLAGALDGPFGTVSGTAAAYLPLIKRGPYLAMRAGGEIGAGEVPVQLAPAIGGKGSLRGYQSGRYTGDAAANLGVELRAPVGTLNFILKSQLGLFALADAGRVWFDGASSGDWHTGVGGGFWLSALGKSVSVAYARGDSPRLYLKTGLSY